MVVFNYEEPPLNDLIIAVNHDEVITFKTIPFTCIKYTEVSLCVLRASFIDVYVTLEALQSACALIQKPIRLPCW